MVVKVGFESAIYHWPGFAGDTFTKRFVIKSVRSASNNKFRCAMTALWNTFVNPDE
jgi:hypothetical protein